MAVVVAVVYCCSGGCTGGSWLVVTATGLCVCIGKDLCLVKVFTGHVKIRTRVQEWTRVCNPTCPMKTLTGHKLHPLGYY